MKKSFLLTIVLLASICWISWNKKTYTGKRISTTDVVSCYNMETLNAYQVEASTIGFATLHNSPKTIHDFQQTGKMIHFPTLEGNEANAYFIPSKKKTKNWLIVIQEWWGLNDNIKNEADKYYKDLGNMNVIAVDMYDGKIATTSDSAMKLMRGADMKRMVSIIQGAITYAELSYAATYKLGLTSVINMAGNAILPSSDSAAAAGGVATIDDATGVLTFDYLTKDSDAYPFTATTYALVSTKYGDAAKAKAVKDTIAYHAFTCPGKYPTLGFAQLTPTSKFGAIVSKQLAKLGA